MKKIFTLALLAFTVAASAQVRIFEIYGGGGNTGATIKNDYVILYNAGLTSVSIDGWGLQYASATGTFGSTSTANVNICNLGGTIPAGGYYLIKLAAGASATATEITSFDVNGNFTMANSINPIAASGTAGKFVLLNNRVYFTGTTATATPTGANVVDFVGFGLTANAYEGTGPTPAPSNTTAVRRKNGGQDTNDNAADFEAVAPAPQTTLNQQLISTTTGILPIELLSFKGTRSGNVVELAWETASEKNNDYFSIERSANGVDFVEIGTVKGNGNIVTTTKYAFTDANPMAVNYYRLKQVDTDGTFSFSKTVSVNMGSKSNKTLAYPTLATDILTVELPTDNADLTVTNANGQVVLTQKATAERVELSIEALPQGNYFLMVKTATQLETVRFTKR